MSFPHYRNGERTANRDHMITKTQGRTSVIFMTLQRAIHTCSIRIHIVFVYMFHENKITVKKLNKYQYMYLILINRNA